MVFYVAISGRIVELRLRGVDEYRILHVLAVIQLGARKLQAGHADDGRRILDDQHRQPFGRYLIGLRHHDAVAVRIDEVRIDPARSRLAELREIQFARRQHHLAKLAVDGIAIDVGVGVNVGPVGLELRDGVVKSVPIPQAHVVQQRLMLFEIHRLVGLGGEFHLIGALVDSKCRTRGLDMLFDVWPLDRDLVGLHVRRADDGRNHVAQHDGAD